MGVLTHRQSESGGRPAGIRRSRPYLSELESLRGLAILLVSAFHLDLSVMARLFTPPDGSTTLAESYVRAGYTGVSLFFTLSGFLLGGEFLAEVGGGRAVSRRDYFARRALRILPLYYGAVAIAAVVAARQPADVLLGAPYLVFLNAFERFEIPLGSFSAVWWSLATEAQFYVLLPVLAWLLRPNRCRFGAALLAVYGLAYAAFACAVAQPAKLHSQVLLSHSLFGQAPLFLFGWLAAWLYRRDGERLRNRLAAAPWARNGGADLALMFALLALGLLLRWTLTLGPYRDAPPFAAWHLPEGLLWTSLLLLLLLAPLRLKPLFCNRVLGGLGVISYALYLAHVPLIGAVFTALRGIRPDVLVGWTWRTAALAVGISALCLSVSWAIYRLIERPFLLRKARLDR